MLTNYCILRYPHSAMQGRLDRRLPPGAVTITNGSVAVYAI